MSIPCGQGEQPAPPQRPAYLIDLDGTLYAGETPIPHAAEFLHYLDTEQRPYLLTTNCPSRTRPQLLQKLAAMGIHTSPQHILTSGMAAAEYLRREGLTRVYPLAGPAARYELTTRGLSIAAEQADCVLVAWDLEFTYEKLKRAADFIRGGARLVCTNPDLVIPGRDGPVPHSGSLCAAVECASGVQAEMLGKPGAFMAGLALELLGAAPENTVVVGDLQATDIRFALQNGMRGALVLTGLTKREAILPSDPPDFVFDNLEALRQWDSTLFQ